MSNQNNEEVIEVQSQQQQHDAEHVNKSDTIHNSNIDSQKNNESKENVCATNQPHITKNDNNNSSSSSDDDDDDEGNVCNAGDQKHFTIKQDLFDLLAENGFSENAIKKSIVAGCIDYSTCLQWINMHKGHPELDTPLDDGVEVIVKAKRILTEEERAAKVHELQEKIRLKKEKDKEEQQRKELERIENGRKALETKTLIEALRREQDLREVQREKQAEAEARRRVKIQIIADRYVRQGKSSDEAWERAEAEFKAAAQKAREEAAARLAQVNASSSADRNKSSSVMSSKTNGSVHDTHNASEVHAKTEWDLSSFTKAAPSTRTTLEELFTSRIPSIDDAPTLVNAIKSNHNVALREACLQTLQLILTNIRDNPFDLKKRTLKTSTKAFAQKILPIHDAVQLLRLCNFELCTTSSAADDSNNNNGSNISSNINVTFITCTTVIIKQINYIIDLLSSEN